MSLNESLALADVCLTAISALCMIAGFLAIRREKVERHQQLMLAALAASSMFLLSFAYRFARFGIEAATACASSLGAPLYARFDAIETDGRLHLMELELIEPFLFLEYDPASPTRIAACLTGAIPV